VDHRHFGQPTYTQEPRSSVRQICGP
jgi:hypothetical protein